MARREARVISVAAIGLAGVGGNAALSFADELPASLKLSAVALASVAAIVPIVDVTRLRLLRAPFEVFTARWPREPSRRESDPCWGVFNVSMGTTVHAARKTMGRPEDDVRLAQEWDEPGTEVRQWIVGDYVLTLTTARDVVRDLRISRSESVSWPLPAPTNTVAVPRGIILGKTTLREFMAESTPPLYTQHDGMEALEFLHFFWPDGPEAAAFSQVSVDSHIYDDRPWHDRLITGYRVGYSTKLPAYEVPHTWHGWPFDSDGSLRGPTSQ